MLYPTLARCLDTSASTTNTVIDDGRNIDGGPLLATALPFFCIRPSSYIDGIGTGSRFKERRKLLSIISASMASGA